MTKTLTRGQRSLLAARGFRPEHVGRTWNRAADPERITIPDSPAAMEELLADAARMQKVFQDKGAFGELVSKYARTVLDKDQEIATQVREETQRVLADFLRDEQPADVQRLNLSMLNSAVPSIARQKAGIYNARAMGAKIDKEFSNSAEYFQAIWHGSQRDAALQAKLGRMRNAFDSTVPSEGGFLIPETLRAEILRVALEQSVVRSRARVVPMETLRVPFPTIDTTSNASSVFGGIVGYWTEEGGQLTTSQAAFGRITLEAQKLTAYTEVPNELISDSITSFQAFIDDYFPQAIAWYEDDAFTNGNGVGMPLGFLNAGNTAQIQVTAQPGQATKTIVWENIVAMYSRMLPSSLSNAVWICSHDTFPELATMALSVGTGGAPVWLANGAADAPMTILGRPVIFSEKCPSLGNVGDINFVDLSYYLIGDRQVMSSMSSPHFKFQNDQTAFRVIERVTGRPWIQSAITPKNNSSNTLSPFVSLAAR